MSGGGTKAVDILLARLAGGFDLAHGAVSGSAAAIHVISAAVSAAPSAVAHGLAQFVTRTSAELDELVAAAAEQDLARWRAAGAGGLMGLVSGFGELVEWAVVDRRLALSEAAAALGAAGERAARQADGATAGRCVRVLLELAAGDGPRRGIDRGACVPAYFGPRLVGQQAAVALLRLSSPMASPGRRLHRSGEPVWAVGPVGRDSRTGPNAAAATVAEAAHRLRLLVEQPAGPCGVTAARAAVMALLEGWNYPWRQVGPAGGGGEQREDLVLVQSSTAAPFAANAESIGM